METLNGAVFEGLTAWFSNSVHLKYKTLWIKNRGTVKRVEDALYLFSQDPISEDTALISRHEVFFGEKLTLLHPNFITESVAKGDVRKVSLGLHQLLPTDISQILRHEEPLNNSFLGLTNQCRKIPWFDGFPDGGIIDMDIVPECQGELNIINAQKEEYSLVTIAYDVLENECHDNY